MGQKKKKKSGKEYWHLGNEITYITSFFAGTVMGQRGCVLSRYSLAGRWTYYIIRDIKTLIHRRPSRPAPNMLPRRTAVWESSLPSAYSTRLPRQDSAVAAGRPWSPSTPPIQRCCYTDDVFLSTAAALVEPAMLQNTRKARAWSLGAPARNISQK